MADFILKLRPEDYERIFQDRQDTHISWSDYQVLKTYTEIPSEENGWGGRAKDLEEARQARVFLAQLGTLVDQGQTVTPLLFGKYIEAQQETGFLAIPPQEGHWDDLSEATATSMEEHGEVRGVSLQRDVVARLRNETRFVEMRATFGTQESLKLHLGDQKITEDEMRALLSWNPAEGGRDFFIYLHKALVSQDTGEVVKEGEKETEKKEKKVALFTSERAPFVYLMGAEDRDGRRILAAVTIEAGAEKLLSQYAIRWIHDKDYLNEAGAEARTTTEKVWDTVVSVEGGVAAVVAVGGLWLRKHWTGLKAKTQHWVSTTAQTSPTLRWVGTEARYFWNNVWKSPGKRARLASLAAALGKDPKAVTYKDRLGAWYRSVRGLSELDRGRWLGRIGFSWGAGMEVGGYVNDALGVSDQDTAMAVQVGSMMGAMIAVAPEDKSFFKRLGRWALSLGYRGLQKVAPPLASGIEGLGLGGAAAWLGGAISYVFEGIGLAWLIDGGANLVYLDKHRLENTTAQDKAFKGAKEAYGEQLQLLGMNGKGLSENSLSPQAMLALLFPEGGEYPKIYNKINYEEEGSLLGAPFYYATPDIYTAISRGGASDQKLTQEELLVRMAGSVRAHLEKKTLLRRTQDPSGAGFDTTALGKFVEQDASIQLGLVHILSTPVVEVTTSPENGPPLDYTAMSLLELTHHAFAVKTLEGQVPAVDPETGESQQDPRTGQTVFQKGDIQVVAVDDPVAFVAWGRKLQVEGKALQAVSPESLETRGIRTANIGGEMQRNPELGSNDQKVTFPGISLDRLFVMAEKTDARVQAGEQLVEGDQVLIMTLGQLYQVATGRDLETWALVGDLPLSYAGKIQYFAAHYLGLHVSSKDDLKGVVPVAEVMGEVQIGQTENGGRVLAPQYGGLVGWRDENGAIHLSTGAAKQYWLNNTSGVIRGLYERRTLAQEVFDLNNGTGVLSLDARRIELSAAALHLAQKVEHASRASSPQDRLEAYLRLIFLSHNPNPKATEARRTAVKGRVEEMRAFVPENPSVQMLARYERQWLALGIYHLSKRGQLQNLGGERFQKWSQMGLVRLESVGSMMVPVPNPSNPDMEIAMIYYAEREEEIQRRTQNLAMMVQVDLQNEDEREQLDEKVRAAIDEKVRAVAARHNIALSDDNPEAQKEAYKRALQEEPSGVLAQARDLQEVEAFFQNALRFSDI